MLSCRFLSHFPFSQRRRIWPLYFSHETVHQLFSKAILWSSTNLLYFFFTLVCKMIQWIAYRLIDRLLLYTALLLLYFLFFRVRMNRISFHFDILLNLIFSFVFVLKLMIATQLILKKFSISQSGEFLTELYVLVLTIVVTTLVKAQVFSISEPTSKVFCLEHRSCLRSTSVAFIFVLACT